jgi:plasmid stability protein
MAERIRLIIDTEEEVRLALHLAATRAGKSNSEMANDILRKALIKEIEDAKKYTPPKRKGLAGE